MGNCLVSVSPGRSRCSNFSGAISWQEGGYVKGKTVPKDPWGNDFRYVAQGRRFTLTSLGADGKEGGSGLDADLSNE